MAKKKQVTKRQKVHKGVDNVLDFFGKISDTVSDVTSIAKNAVTEKVNKVIDPIKVRLKYDKRAKTIGYHAIVGEIKSKIKSGDELSEEENIIYNYAINIEK